MVLTKEPVYYTRDGRLICNKKTAEGLRVYKGLLLKMCERQKWFCVLCHRFLSWEEATFDHENPRGMDGAFRDDRIEVERDGRMVWQNAAVHGLCNSLKGSRRNVRITFS